MIFKVYLWQNKIIMILEQKLKCKIHHAIVTYANPDYVGSIQIGKDLMTMLNLSNGELVHVWAVDHKSRIMTYVFEGEPGVIGLNGGAAHYFNPGDRIIVAAFVMTDEKINSKSILVNELNQFICDLEPFSATMEI